MKRAALALVASASFAGLAPAQPPEADPDSPQTHARAVEALSRADRRPISGETRSIQGINLAVAGKAEDVSGLMRDLGAEVRGREARIALSADVLFDFDKAELRPEAAPALEKVAAVLKKLPSAKATIEGHTDARGDDAYNRKLSERRADSVRKWLAANGVANPMASRGLGETKPVAPNAAKGGKDDPEGRRKNRRVEILVEGVDK